MSIDSVELARLRTDFPILSVHGRGGSPIAYFDSAATSQKPACVMDAISEFYLGANAAVNRGTHYLADLSTEGFEGARTSIARFLGADPSGLVWTKNATEALNLVAYGLTGANVLGPGDRVVVTRLEHHANLVPWQRACERTGAELVWLEASADGRLDYAGLDLIDERTKVVAFTHVSNVTGAITDVERVVASARHVGAVTVLDSCQSTAHQPFDFKALGVDFAVASSHKMLGPTGVGALLARPESLERLDAFLTGGAMVEWVEMDSARFQRGPARFEAGSQPVAQAVGWAQAVSYLECVGMERVQAHEDAVGELIAQQLQTVPGLKLLGPTEGDRAAVFSFALPGIHPHDVGQFLDSMDVAVRVGHHCAIPVHQHFGVRSSTRASASLTTTPDEVERLGDALRACVKFFGGLHV